MTPKVYDGQTVLDEGDWYGCMQRVSLENLSESILWNLVIEHWPADRSAKLGLRKEYRNASRVEAALLDDDMRAVMFGLLNALMESYDTRPPTRDGRLIKFIDEVREVLEEHDPRPHLVGSHNAKSGTSTRPTADQEKVKK